MHQSLTFSVKVRFTSFLYTKIFVFSCPTLKVFCFGLTSLFVCFTITIPLPCCLEPPCCSSPGKHKEQGHPTGKSHQESSEHSEGSALPNESGPVIELITESSNCPRQSKEMNQAQSLSTDPVRSSRRQDQRQDWKQDVTTTWEVLYITYLQCRSVQDKYVSVISQDRGLVNQTSAHMKLLEPNVDGVIGSPRWGWSGLLRPMSVLRTLAIATFKLLHDTKI